MARAMKDSGIEWIGVIPEEWSVVSLGRLFSASAGGDAKQELYSDYQDETHPYPVYTNTLSKDQVYAYTTTPFFQSNTITVTGRGAIGHAFYRDTPYDAIIRLLSLCPKQTLNCRFYAYWIDTVIPFFTDSAAIGQLSAIQITKYKTLFLPLREQDKISEYLDIECSKIDTIIEQTRASIEEYRKLKQSVITQAVTKGIRPGRKMKGSGVEWIGEIAEDYELEKLKYVCEILDQYRSPITADQRNQNAEVLYDYYGASGAIDKIDGYTIDDHVMLIGEDGANLRMRNLPLMYEVNGKAWINNHAHILKPKDGMDFHYLFFTLEALDINPYITGSAQPKLSQDNLKNIWLPVPVLDEQIEVAGFIREQTVKIDALIRKKRLYLSELESYKKSLIFEYVTGKKEVI